MVNQFQDEREFLDKASSTYSSNDASQTECLRRLVVRTIAPYLDKNGTGLELGCSDGYMTELLSREVGELVVVDGSSEFVEKAKLRLKEKNLTNVDIRLSLFEEYDTAERYDYIIASHILEHVQDPIEILTIAKNLLKSDGVLYIVVPNAGALSRQLGLHMGLYSDLKALTENDMNHGHRRVYDRASLNKDLSEAGLSTVVEGGILLKPFPDFQMADLIDKNILKEEQIEGLYSLGKEYPDLCGALYSICR